MIESSFVSKDQPTLCQQHPDFVRTLVSRQKEDMT